MMRDGDNLKGISQLPIDDAVREALKNVAACVVLEGRPDVRCLANQANCPVEFGQKTLRLPGASVEIPVEGLADLLPGEANEGEASRVQSAER